MSFSCEEAWKIMKNKFLSLAVAWKMVKNSSSKWKEEKLKEFNVVNARNSFTSSMSRARETNKSKEW